MKAGATALLLAAAAVYVLARHWETGGSTAAGYLRAAAEAGMVGGLADWFAVTALFRRPLGLPIPHTAIIPTRKDALGHHLGDFVGTNFLSAQVVRERLDAVDAAGRAGGWLAQPDHAERVAAELAALARGALGVLRDDDIQAVLEQALSRRLAAVPIGPPLGRLLGQIVADQAHRPLLDLAAERVHSWLLDNRDQVVATVAAQAPSWSPRFVDERVAVRAHAEMVRVVAEIRADPDHATRRATDQFLTDLAESLRSDPATMARANAVATGLASRADVRDAVRDLLAAGRRAVLELIEAPASELRTRITTGLAQAGRRITGDTALRAKVNGWLSDAAVHVVTHYREELTRTITDTVQRWDGAETSRKIELQVGRDLQFIRINGTVVGALAGLAIYAASQLLP